MSAFEAARNWDLNNSKPRAWNFEGCSKGANKQPAAIFRQASSSKATAAFRPLGPSFGGVTARHRAFARIRKLNNNSSAERRLHGTRTCALAKRSGGRDRGRRLGD